MVHTSSSTELFKVTTGLTWEILADAWITFLQ